MSNNFTITGNLVAEPELRFTQNGRAVFKARIADTPRRKNPDTGEWEDAGPALFLNVELWGREAEAIAEIMDGAARGRLTAWGTLVLEQYTTKDGEERESLLVKAQAVKFHPRNEDGGGQQRQQGGGQRRQQQATPANPWGGGGATADPWGGGGPAVFPDEPPF